MVKVYTAASKSYPLIFVFLIFLLLPLVGVGADIYSKAITGNWEDPNTWVGNNVPGNKDNVFIVSGATITAQDDVYIPNNYNLNVDGTLIIEGNLTMGNESDLNTGSNSSLIIYENATVGNNIDLNLTSYFIVLGNFTKGGSAGQGTFYLNGAHVYIMGTVNEPWPGFVVCDGSYDGTTSIGEDCDGGTLVDFIDHVQPEELPPGIFDEIVQNNKVYRNALAMDPSNGVFCSSGSVSFVITSYSIHYTKLYDSRPHFAT